MYRWNSQTMISILSAMKFSCCSSEQHETSWIMIPSRRSTNPCKHYSTVPLQSCSNLCHWWRTHRKKNWHLLCSKPLQLQVSTFHHEHISLFMTVNPIILGFHLLYLYNHGAIRKSWNGTSFVIITAAPCLIFASSIGLILFQPWFQVSSRQLHRI